MVVSLPYDARTFTVLNPSGKNIPKKFPHAMLSVKLQFFKPGSLHCTPPHTTVMFGFVLILKNKDLRDQ